MKYSLLFLFATSIIYFAYGQISLHPAGVESFNDKAQYTLIKKPLKPKDAFSQPRKNSVNNRVISQHNNMQDLESILLYSQDIDDRLYALKQLEIDGGPAALNIIEKALADKNSRVRRGVIAALSSFQAKDVIHLLGQVLFSSTDQALKLQVIDVILEKNTIAGNALLYFVASNDQDEVIRNYTENELVNYSALKVAPVEDDSRVQDDYYFILQNAYFQKPEQAIKGFHAVLSHAETDQFRKEALLALANRNEPQADLIIEQALSDKSSEVRLLVIQILANSRENVLPLLGRVLLSESDETLRVEVVKLIALESNPAKIEFLKLALNDSSQQVSDLANEYLQANEDSIK